MPLLIQITIVSQVKTNSTGPTKLMSVLSKAKSYYLSNLSSKLCPRRFQQFHILHYATQGKTNYPSNIRTQNAKGRCYEK
jgi:hypothetical protein